MFKIRVSDHRLAENVTSTGTADVLVPKWFWLAIARNSGVLMKAAFHLQEGSAVVDSGSLLLFLRLLSTFVFHACGATSHLRHPSKLKIAMHLYFQILNHECSQGVLRHSQKRLWICRFANTWTDLYAQILYNYKSDNANSDGALQTTVLAHVICTEMTAHRVSTDGWEVVVAVLDVDDNSGWTGQTHYFTMVLGLH